VVSMGFLMLILDANGASLAGSRARSSSVCRDAFILDSILANWPSDMVAAWSIWIWDEDDMAVVGKGACWYLTVLAQLRLAQLLARAKNCSASRNRNCKPTDRFT
jgi:hypothetical protein